MLEKIGLNTDIMIICMFAFIFVLLILVFILLGRTSRLTKTYVKYMKGANGRSLEAKFDEKFKDLESMTDDIVDLKSKVAVLEAVKTAGFCKFAIEKYDAFSGIGGKLSFSLCMLNDGDDGFILTAMHSTEGCYTYLKEVIKGKTFIKVSDKEEKVLKKALVYNDPVAEYIGR